MSSNASNNFNYAGTKATGGGTSNVNVLVDVSTYQEQHKASTGFQIPNLGLGSQYSFARPGSGLVHVEIRTDQPITLPTLPTNVLITLWQSEVDNPTANDWFPSYQLLEFTPFSVNYMRSTYKTQNNYNSLATELRVIYPWYFFTLENRGFIDPDYDVWICHSIHRNV
jgi:hypothetical protein